MMTMRESESKLGQNAIVAELNVADQVGREMYARDKVGRRLGMRIEEIRPGYARIAMNVTADMINGHDICHGGFIFTLVDTACAYAANSRNQNTLSQALNIVFIAPAGLDTTLVAEAIESAHSGRTAIYEIKVTTDPAQVIAVAQAQCRVMRGLMVEGLSL
jgi:acyl-CoA thioesterase